MTASGEEILVGLIAGALLAWLALWLLGLMDLAWMLGWYGVRDGWRFWRRDRRLRRERRS